MPKVPVALTVQPKLWGCPEEPRQPKGGIGRDPPLPVDDLIDPGEGNVDPLGQLGLRHVQRLKELLEEHLTGMGRRAVLGKHNDQQGRGSAVVVDDFNVFRAGLSPSKADAEPVVDPDAVLASTISDKEFQSVSWWGA